MSDAWKAIKNEKNNWLICPLEVLEFFPAVCEFYCNNKSLNAWDYRETSTFYLQNMVGAVYNYVVHKI